MMNSTSRHFRARCAAITLLTGLAVGVVPIAKAEVELSWNGFGTFAGGYHDDASINGLPGAQYNGYDRGSSYDVDSKLGLQGTVQITESVSATTQIVTLGIEDYEPDVDWAYLAWDLSPEFRIRVGRLQAPAYRYSDYIRIGYAYPWIRPPVEVYSRDLLFFSEVDAVNLLYERYLDDWSIGIEAYYGNSSGDAEVIRNQTVDYKIRDDVGISLSGERDWFNFRVAYRRLPHTMIGDTSLVQPLYAGLRSVAAFFPQVAAVADELSTDDIEVEFFSIALGVDYQNWLFDFEYIDVPVERSIAVDEQSWYALFGRRIDAYTFHYTYAERLRENSHDFSLPIRAQANLIAGSNPIVAGQLNELADGVDLAVSRAVTDHFSHTIGIRYDFDTTVAIKTEYQRIRDKNNNLSSNLISFAVDFYF